MRHRRNKTEIKNNILRDAHSFVEKKHREKRIEGATYWRLTNEEELNYKKLCSQNKRRGW